MSSFHASDLNQMVSCKALVLKVEKRDATEDQK